MQSSFQKKYEQGLNLALNGNLNSAFDVFDELKTESFQNLKYSSLVNMSTMKYQQGFYKEALKLLQQAIGIDSFNYIAYYNKFVIYFSLYKNYTNLKNAQEALNCALSCIHSQIASKLLCNYDPSNQHLITKNISKSIGFCENNVVGYLVRGRLYELLNKSKLAENQFDTAQYYNREYGLIYLLRAQFFWRSLLQEKNQQKKEKNRAKIENDLHQYYFVMANSPRTAFKLKPSQQESTPSSITINQIQTLYEKFRQTLTELESLPKIQANEKFQQTFNQENFNEDVSVDNVDDSKNLSLEIQKLQKEIKSQRGKVGTQQNKSEQQSQSQSETFLATQIEKATKEIEHYKKEVEPNSPQTKPISDVLSNNSSFSSNTGRRTISEIELKQFKNAKIQIVSAQIFQDANKLSGRPGTIILKYSNDQNKEEKLLTSPQTQYIWHQKFDISIAHLLLDESENSCKIQVLFELASKSIWSSKVLVGRGFINILEMGQNQCLLEKNQTKTGVVYYKLKLQ